MIRALTTSATGLEAQQSNIERISNDLANVNTDAYKRVRTEFADLMYETIKEPGAQLGSTTQSPTGIQTGMGVRVAGSHKIFEQGPARITNAPFDMMIEGQGFIPVSAPNGTGEVMYTRNGAFHLDSTARLTLNNGAQLIPQITVPQNAIKVNIRPNGEISAILASQEEQVLGQVQLVTFSNPEGLLAHGSGLYKGTLASGTPVQGVPGENGVGSILQGALEGSNVNVANSMVDMISTQRAYEMGTRTMKTVDEMLGWTANIK